MEEELGMNLFLGDDYEFDDDQTIDPNEHLVADNLHDDEDPADEQDQNDINDEPIENENSEGVDGDDTEDDENDSNTDDNSSPPLYKSLASVLHEQGALSSVDSSKFENVKTIEEFNELIDEEAKARELRDLTELQKEALEAFRAGIDVETFKLQKQTENDLESITVDDLTTDEDLRRQIIYQDFINQGFSEQKSLKLTNRSFEVDEDVDDAKEALESIKLGLKEKYREQLEYEKNEKEKAQKEFQAKQKELEKSILETAEPFKGIKLNETARKHVLSTMMIPVGKNPNTGTDENALMKDQRESKDFSQRLYTVYTLSKGFTDFSYFGKTEKSKANNDLERALKNNQHISTGGDMTFLDDADANDYEIGDKIIWR